ncbi:MAG: HDIG domain-containing protein [Planctomycetia bacterium]|nr:HDIG domain-containing protein [Planctomycetia bacterium]
MSSGTSKARAKRLAAMEFVPTRWGRAVANLQRADVELRLLVFILFITAIAIILQIWNPPFPYHTGYLVDRDIVARVNFQVYDKEATERARMAERNRVLYIFDKTPDTMKESVDQLRRVLKEAMALNAESFQQLPENIRIQFEPLTPDSSPASLPPTGESGSDWNFLRQNPSRTHSAPPVSPPPVQMNPAPVPPAPQTPPSASSGSGILHTPEIKNTPEKLPVKDPAVQENKNSSASFETPSVQENRPLPLPISPATSIPVTNPEKILSPERKTETPPSSESPRHTSEKTLTEAGTLSHVMDTVIPARELRTQTPASISATDTHSDIQENAEKKSDSPSSISENTETSDSIRSVPENEEKPESTRTTEIVHDPPLLKEEKAEQKDDSPEIPPPSDTPAEKFSKEEGNPPLLKADPSATPEKENTATKEAGGSSSSVPSVPEETVEIQDPENKRIEDSEGKNIPASVPNTTPEQHNSAHTAGSVAAPSEMVSVTPINPSVSAEDKKESFPEKPPITVPENPVDIFCDRVAAIMQPFFQNGLMHLSEADEVKKDPLGRGSPIYVDIMEYDTARYLSGSMTPNGGALPFPPGQGISDGNGLNASTGNGVLPPPVPGVPPVVVTTQIRKQVALQELIIESNLYILRALRNEFGREVGERVYFFICRNWQSNLKLNLAATQRALTDAANKITDVFTPYERSQRIVSIGTEGDPTVGLNLKPQHVTLLRAENDAWLAQRTFREQFCRALAAILVILATLIPTTCYIAFTEPQVITQWKQQFTLILITIVALLLSISLSTDTWRFTLLPLILYSQLVTILYHRKIGLAAGFTLAILIAVGLSVPLTELLMYFGVLLVSVLPLDRIRGRLQFIKIGFAAGCVSFLLSYSSDTLAGQQIDNFYMPGATFNFVQLLLTGFLIQGIMPLLENWLGILSDARLLELCDQSNPLLGELIDRAPSTYSHSMAVGSLGERAAEAINCDGLLVRAASYYHDIGKIYKPDYYAENQSITGINHHLELEPTMSALIIIAHIKNGVDIARQYKLPERIIDIIQQHHGTTLVKFFYTEAVKKNGNSTGPLPVDESTFSYPGPKPQTKEAVIVMLADCCESACRTIVDPTPKRIEGLVSKIVQERLDEGQFDDSGMTLRELRAVEDSLVKSLISNYHGRIKYPEMKKEEKLKPA